MPDLLVYLRATATAVIVSAAVGLAVGLLWRTASTVWLNSANVLAIGCGLGAGYYVMSMLPLWPPANGLDRFLTFVIPAVLGIELLAGLRGFSPRLAWLLRMSLAAALPRVLLHGSIYLTGDNPDWTRSRAVTMLGVCFALSAGVWWLLSCLSRRPCGNSIPMALSLSTLCAGLMVMMAGYIKGGAAALPLMAAIVTTTIVMMQAARRAGATDFIASASIGVGVMGLCGLLLIGCFFGRLPTTSALVVLFAPLLCWVTETPWLRRRNTWLVGAIRMALVAIPLLIVLVTAKRHFDQEMGPLLGKAKVYRDTRLG